MIQSIEKEGKKFELYNEDTQIPLKNLKTSQIQIAGNEKVEQKYKLKMINKGV